jgi:hypothetical protein
MLENVNKNPEVELDLDDAQEANIQLEEKKEEKETKPNLNLGEVDLGYQTYDKDDKPEVSIEETTQEDKQESKPKSSLGEFSEGVQKRIDKLTKRMREAERREEAALIYAEGLKKKYSDVKSKYDEIDENYVKQFDARIDSERDTVRAKLKQAIELQDSEAIITANEELARLTVEKERAKLTLADRERRKKASAEAEIDAPKSQQNQVNTQVEQPTASPKARDWARKNEWFGQDQFMTNTAFQIHENLVAEGFDVDSSEYYNEIDKQIREVYPHKFAESENSVEQPKRPVQMVATASRGKSGRRSVTLTKSQVAIAKKLGVPLEEYAKYVKEV